MKRETILKMVLDISEKFEHSDKEQMYEIYYEVLHATLFDIISGFTEEDFNLIPAPYRTTIEKLEKEIFDFCSEKYQEDVNKYIAENGKFFKKKEEKKEPQRLAGFIVEADEGLNI